MPQATGFWLNCSKPITSSWRQALLNPLSSRWGPCAGDHSLSLHWFTSSFTILCKVWSSSRTSFTPLTSMPMCFTRARATMSGAFTLRSAWHAGSYFIILTCDLTLHWFLLLAVDSLGSLFHLQIFAPSSGVELISSSCLTATARMKHVK